MFFLGTHTPKLDEKGRLVLPAKFRDALAEGLVISTGQEYCLTVWPEPVFMAEVKRAQAMPMTHKPTRDYLRVLLPGAETATPDKQGRISIPAHLRAVAGIERDVVVTGVGDRVEIWDPQRWADYSTGAVAAFASIDEAPEA
ncbi:division/cell wall cluster transcriptional repressor MraZ [Nocardioides acrostichi]|uniref:Transcriptional regulator MraZ n=1 Tax=Nocardioides acrostichi TaxID=2784339 RepID=A0A930UUV8_9ACTN|nr:division/cell wall cluster transcriptional repressor MraZ [Nocardioides acrostichi]MBF4160616.1 division/cell wall cluster transcriptional repressor MraZ [Nocardioides acrostichi]